MNELNGMEMYGEDEVKEDKRREKENLKRENKEKRENFIIDIIAKVGRGAINIWSKTIFPEKIRAYKEKKAWKRRIEQEAREEAREEVEREIKSRYKQQEIDKVKGVKSGKNFLEKLAKGFDSGDGKSGKGFDTTEKLNRMLGGSQQQTNIKGPSYMRDSGIGSMDKINMMMGGKQPIKPMRPMKPIQPIKRKKTKYKKRRKKKQSRPQQQYEEQPVESFKNKMKRLMS